ncbi:MAG: helix-turn-helix domain-containing protein [Pseudomonadota bacterium]|nr:helix-turn-helix domain-containing protein [Pseudomonadota bacterium]MEE3100721.1 helix-turn-helix domain-containing protein [Pseudomonadota bacterium]
MARTREHNAQMMAAPDPVPRSPGAVKSAGRVLQVLEFFEDVRRPARATEISEALEMPQSSTSILMRSLRDLGYLDYDHGTRTFLPSPRVSLLGAWLDGGPIRDGRLTRMMERLTEQTDKTSFVAARNGIFAQYIYTVPSSSTLRFHLTIGARRLLVWSAAGFMLMTGMEDAEIRALTRRTAAEIPDFRHRADEVLANVEIARERGHYLSRGLVTPSAGAIAIRLPEGIDAAGRPLALAFGGLQDQLEQQEEALVAAMRAMVRDYLKAAD